MRSSHEYPQADEKKAWRKIVAVHATLQQTGANRRGTKAREERKGRGSLPPTLGKTVQGKTIKSWGEKRLGGSRLGMGTRLRTRLTGQENGPTGE